MRPGRWPVGCSIVRVAVALRFTEADIERAAGPGSFQRGLECLDAVADVVISSREITAVVDDGQSCQVTLVVSDDGLAGSCTCAEDGFCGHCAATGLTVLEFGNDMPRHVEARQAHDEAVRSWLESLSRDELLAELLDLLDEDPDLRQRYRLRVHPGD
jgi:uncharacterized Zn finger protein